MAALRSWTQTPAFKAYVGEFIGSFVLILLGQGVNAQLINTNNPALDISDGGAWLAGIIGWAVAVIFGVLVTWNASGGHINPTITLAMALSGSLPWGRVPGYLIAQFLGCFTGASFTYFNNIRILHDESTARVFYTSPAVYASVTSAIFTEALSTTIFVILIMTIADQRNRINPVYQPFLFSLPIMAIGLSLGKSTGWALNAARDFGPRMFAWTVYGNSVWTTPTAYFCVPLFAPLIGSVLGTYIYKFLIPNVELVKIDVTKTTILSNTV